MDFLVNEGFDAARISVFAATTWNKPGCGEEITDKTKGELVDALRRLANPAGPVCCHLFRCSFHHLSASARPLT